MLKKRVIFTLLYADGSFMLSRNFRLQKVGDLRWLQKNYNFAQTAFSIDELIILDVTRQGRDIEKFGYHVSRIAEECFLPIAVGGGVRNVEQVKTLLRTGADKVVVNSVLDISPEAIQGIAEAYGSQCIIASVDAKRSPQGYEVWTGNGSKQQQALTDWINRIIQMPVGEIYLNSMDRDGTGQGFLLDMLQDIPANMPIPLILAGGAGNHQHMTEALTDSRVDAVATANLFNFVGDGLMKARSALIADGFDLARWDAGLAKKLKFSEVTIN